MLKLNEVVILIVAVLATACKGGGHQGDHCSGCGGGWNGGQVELAPNIGADLTSAKGVMIAPSAQAKSKNAETVTSANADVSAESSENEDKSLYVIKGDDSAELIKLTRSNDGQIKPLKIFNTKKYVIVNFDRWAPTRLVYKGNTCSLVLARKTDGAMFCAEADMHCGEGWNSCDEESIQTDETGDMIYAFQNGTIQKLDMRNPSNLTVSNVFRNGTDGWADALAVNTAGDALITFSTNDGSRYLRGINSNGGLSPLGNGSGANCLVAGVGEDSSKFYYVDAHLGIVAQVDNKGGSFSKSVYYNYWLNGESFDSVDCRPGASSIARTSNHIFVRTGWSHKIIDLINPDKHPLQYKVSGVDDIKRIVGSGNALVIEARDYLGKSMILSYDTELQATDKDDPTAMSIEVIMPAKDYVISALAISAKGSITFSGQRLYDGARVMAEIRAGTHQVDLISLNYGQVSEIIRIF